MVIFETENWSRDQKIHDRLFAFFAFHESLHLTPTDNTDHRLRNT